MFEISTKILLEHSGGLECGCPHVHYEKQLTDISAYDGINLRREIAKIRGGGLLWNIISHIDQKAAISLSRLHLKIPGF